MESLYQKSDQQTNKKSIVNAKVSQKNFQYFIPEVILLKFQLPGSWSLYGAGAD